MPEQVRLPFALMSISGGHKRLVCEVEGCTYAAILTGDARDVYALRSATQHAFHTHNTGF